MSVSVSFDGGNSLSSSESLFSERPQSRMRHWRLSDAVGSALLSTGVGLSGSSSKMRF